MAYTLLIALIRMLSMMHFNCKAMPTNDTDYSCRTKAVEFFNQPHGFHIILLVITSLGGGHTYFMGKINF